MFDCQIIIKMYWIVKKISDTYESYNNDGMDHTQQEMEERILTHNIKKRYRTVKTKYCTLCQKDILNMDQHMGSKNHIKNSEKFCHKYYQHLENNKRKLQIRKGVWGIGKERKKLAIFKSLYNFELWDH